VGTKMLQVLEERNFPVTELIPVASEKSVGKQVTFKGKPYTIVGMQTAIDLKPAVAIFFCWWQYIYLVGTCLCGSGYHRHRQFLRLEDGPYQKTGGTGDQRGRVDRR